MTASLELYVLHWGLYPRRVLLYLAHKGLLSSGIIKITPVSITDTGLHAPEKPPGSVPILRLPDGTFIKQSLAIMDFFEDVCENPDRAQDWQLELAKTADRDTNMRGSTSEEKAKMREILALADEATSQFAFACHKGTALFVPLEETNALTAKLALEYCRKTLKLVEKDYATEVARSIDSGRVSIADCVLLSLLQFSRELYGVDLLSERELPVLRRFREMLRTRSFAGLEEPEYPEQLKSLACQWLSVE